MNIENFKNLKVTVMGLGLHGGGLETVRFLADCGANVLVTDLKPEIDLLPSVVRLKKHKNIKFILGRHQPEDFINTQLIIKNPAVDKRSPYLEIAKKHKIPVDTDMGIFFELCPCPIIGVTGTKGKSTTASLIFKIFSKKFSRIVLAGNIRVPVLRKLKELDRKSLCVLELSSWQLEDCISHKKSPSMAIILNLLSDHLDRYLSFQGYIEAKKNIFKFQKKGDFLILNFDDPVTRSFSDEAPGKFIFFSKEKKNINTIKALERGAYFDGDNIFFQQQEDLILKKEEIPLLGEHNLSNVLAAISAAKLYRLPNDLIKQAIINFKPPEGRLELIDDFQGIAYYNDTTASMPDATIAALKSFPQGKKVILLAGGKDKKLNYDNLARVILKKVKKLVLFKGNASQKIKESLSQAICETKKGSLKKIIAAENIEKMEEAVQIAKSIALRGDIVLLSPAAASFNLFRHEFDRGDQFTKAVKGDVGLRQKDLP